MKIMAVRKENHFKNVSAHFGMSFHSQHSNPDWVKRYAKFILWWVMQAVVRDMKQ
jgi:hypothetical protein